jgi:hypothetical protein
LAIASSSVLVSGTSTDFTAPMVQAAGQSPTDRVAFADASVAAAAA